MSNTTPSGTDAPVVQSVPSASHPMVPPPGLMSQSLMISDPSIRAAVRRNSKLTQIALVILAVVALGCFAFAVLFASNQINDNRNAVQSAEQAARAKQIVVAQAMRSAVIEDEDPVVEEKRVYFNISSAPPGADVYVDGLFVGQTGDSLEKRFKQSNATSQVIVALDGYYVEKLSFSHAKDFSELVTLNEIPVVQAVVKEKVDKGEVTTNNAIVVGVPSARPTKAKKADAKQAAAVPADDIILPD